jgi:alginate O-acetyltransferase complex protein AlgI
MLFCTLPFLGFFLAVLTVYWALPWPRARVWLLLGASIYFYGQWSKWLALVVLASATADYGLARAMDACSRAGWRRAFLLVSVLVNLTLLCYFKYANFFLGSLHDALAVAGLHASFPVLQVLAPIGLSFYTFEAISYTVDVYRGRMRAEPSLANFLLFILFFPHLVSGPIVRAWDFLPQVRRKKHWSWLRAHRGATLILLGLFKKLVLADRMGLIADTVFPHPLDFDTATLWAAAIAYTVQIYCDFSGYTDMALGCAHLLGYHLSLNFNLPYLAVNVSDFWRRWHISLSSWLRDYVYIPLGGSRCTRWRASGNLFFVMVLCGLWHGPSWNNILFGALHGTLLLVHARFRDLCAAVTTFRTLCESAAGTVARVALTMLSVVLIWVVFRAPGLAIAGQYLAGMFGLAARPPQGNSLPCPHPAHIAFAAAVMIVGHAAARLPRWDRVVLQLPAPARALGYVSLLVSTLLLAPFNTRLFVYFQF